MRRIISVRRGSTASDRIQEGFSSLAEIRAFPTTDILDKTVAVLEGSGLFTYDSAGVGADDDGVTTITPDSGVGRWFSVLGGTPPVVNPAAIVYRPGGVAAAGIYVDEVSFLEALALMQGEKFVTFDCSIAPIELSGSSVDFSQVHAYGKAAVGEFRAVVKFMDGFEGLGCFASAENIWFQKEGAESVFRLSGATSTTMTATNCAFSTGSSPLFYLTEASTLNLYLHESGVELDAGVVFLLEGASQLYLTADSSSAVLSNVIEDDGTCSTYLYYDGTSIIHASQIGITGTVTMFNTAYQRDQYIQDIVISPSNTILCRFHAPYDLLISAIKLVATTAPTTAGSYTFAAAGNTANLLDAVSYNLETLVNNVLTSVPLNTTNPEYLYIRTGQLIQLTFLSDNIDLAGSGLQVQVLYHPGYTESGE